jgi:hypothetical protein
MRQRSDVERAEEDALITLMEAMSDPKKTMRVYFAMAAAMAPDGRLSDQDAAEGEDICRGFGQHPLTEKELQSVAQFARQRF